MHVELLKHDVLSTNDVIQLREQFVTKYCETKKWDRSNLSFEQVIEIRAHKEWKNPGMLKS